MQIKSVFFYNYVLLSYRLFIDSCAGKEKASNWIVKLLQSLEKRYPKSFDKVISDPKHSMFAKQIIGMRSDFKGQSDIFEKLHHPNPVVRTEAVTAVPDQLEPVLVFINVFNSLLILNFF